MPIYEYKCPKCKTIIEKLKLSNDINTEFCPNCNTVMKKQISLSSFILKGTGWYKTDYQMKGKNNGS